jgi:hypothetical protein
MSEFMPGRQPRRELRSTSEDEWPAEVRSDFAVNANNGRVAGELLFENERVRVWSIRLQPGERYVAHRHVLDYFWTTVSAGTSLQHSMGGKAELVHYELGDTMFFSYGEGDSMLHDLGNAGATELAFTTVELKESANAPLPINSGGE